ncbi:MAG TPA: anion permease [Candidatus Lachnoclostridium avicola]|nr:anion permease [Candidatus Lachnoclostridium avicola]
MSQSLIVAIILIGMIIVFFGGWIPMAAAALAVPMLLQITGILSFEEAWAGFSSDTVVSLVVLFILGGILNQTTFLSDLRVIVTKMGDGNKGKRKVLLAAMLMSMVFSTFASPVSAMAIMLPIVVALAKDTGLPVKNTIKACTDVACSSNNVLPFGTALTAYITFNGYLEAAGATERFEFIDPFLAKVPIFIVFFLYIYFIGFKHYAKSDERHESNMGEGKKKRDEKNKEPLSPGRNRLGKILFFGSAGLMILASIFTDIDMYMIGAVAILIALATKVITQKEAIRSIRWETIFIYGGTVSLSTAMNNSGLNEIIANGMSSMLGGVTNVYIVAGAFFLASFTLTQFTSNRTVGAVFRPISIAAAVGLGIDPRFTLLAIHYGSSLSTLTPMATSCQLLAYNEGGFNMKEFAIGSIGPALVYFITFMIWFPVCFNVL